MAVKTDTQLKSYFQTGLKPTQSNFEDLIDSCFNGNVTWANIQNKPEWTTDVATKQWSNELINNALLVNVKVENTSQQMGMLKITNGTIKPLYRRKLQMVVANGVLKYVNMPANIDFAMYDASLPCVISTVTGKHMFINAAYSTIDLTDFIGVNATLSFGIAGDISNTSAINIQYNGPDSIGIITMSCFILYTVL